MLIFNDEYNILRGTMNVNMSKGTGCLKGSLKEAFSLYYSVNTTSSGISYV